MSIVRRKDERLAAPLSRKIFGGDGEIVSYPILTSIDEMNGKGRLYEHVHIEPGCSIGWHIHKGDSETYYIIKGHGEYSDNGELIEVFPGDVTVVNSGEGHSLRNLGDSTLELIALILYS